MPNTSSSRVLPNQRMKLSWRGGRSKGKGSLLIAAAHHAAYARFVSQMPALILSSTITCPNCGFVKQEPMPENACVHFYECSNCHQILRPRFGECCVFCSYGSHLCPPRQLEAGTG